MLKVRIIPCLDVKDDKVVKGVKFKAHEIVGDILALAKRYSEEGADELVFYDITASSDKRTVDRSWIRKIADVINIPFCVAGGIRSVHDAQAILEQGADKVSINSPALAHPALIDRLAKRFGQQSIVVGIDSFESNNGEYLVYQYTGRAITTSYSGKKTMDWAREVADRGAGEIVLNCMNQDGMRLGYDIKQLQAVEARVSIPIVASGGAGTAEHFKDLFQKTAITGALAASVFHKKLMYIGKLKAFLHDNNIAVRL